MVLSDQTIKLEMAAGRIVVEPSTPMTSSPRASICIWAMTSRCSATRGIPTSIRRASSRA